MIVLKNNDSVSIILFVRGEMFKRKAKVIQGHDPASPHTPAVFLQGCCTRFIQGGYKYFWSPFRALSKNQFGRSHQE